MTQTASAPPAGPAPERMTWEAFLAADFEGDVEWVDGEVVHVAGPSERHQAISAWLLEQLFALARVNPGMRVFFETFVMRAGADLPGRSPDICIVLSEHRARIRGSYLDGPADVAVEIVSPSTGGVDRGQKFYEYEAGGVSEYWLIDPQRRVAEFYRLTARGVYEAAALGGGLFESTVLPGFTIDVNALWASTEGTAE